MPLIFQGSPKHTIGVEVELQIIDPETLDLSPGSGQILRACQDQGVKRIKMELHESMLEVDTEIADDVKTCYKMLSQRMQHLHEIVKGLNLELCVLGTHPFQIWAERCITKKDRYQNLYQKFQWLVRRMNVYGMHVHVGVKTSEQVVVVCRSMLKYLPYLLALSANSPFWQGIDTGMDSCRVNIIESFPLSGMPFHFVNWNEFEHYHDTLSRVGAIGSLKDLYWHVRPNVEFGTVEIRICDAMTSLHDTMALVAFIQCLVVWICERHQENPKELEDKKEHLWIAPENEWIAARDGLEGLLITDLQGNRQKISEGIFELIETLAPIARRLNCQEELESLAHLVRKGNGAQRQRKIFQETQSLQSVTKHAIEEFTQSIQG